MARAGYKATSAFFHEAGENMRQVHKHGLGFYRIL